MDIFSRFCNICCKNDTSLQNICDGSIDYLKDILIIFIGREDIINNNVIYLCKFCRDQVIHFNKFRAMCCNNLIQLRQLYHYKLSKLEMDAGASTVKSMSESFLREILRNNGFAMDNSEDLTSNLEVVLNEGDFGGNSSVEYVLSNEEKIASNTAIEKITENVNVKIEPAEEEDNIENVELENIKSEFNDHFLNYTSYEYEKCTFDEPVGNINKSNTYPIETTDDSSVKKTGSTSTGLELEGNQNETTDEAPFVFVQVKTEEDDPLAVTQNKSTASTIDRHPSRLHVRDDSNGRSPTALHSATHKRAHPDAKPNVCVVCEKSFGTKSHLVRHESIHSRIRPYECTVCNTAFAQASALKTHERIHSGDRPYKCPVCNKAFAQSSTLTIHKRMHSGERPYKCTFCNKAFINSSNLIAHTRAHSGDKPYKCPLCNKAFTMSSALTTHARMHSGDRPYKCTLCNKAFINSSNLSAHTRAHIGDRPYQCPICNKAFAQSSGLTTHKRTHSGDKPYKCTVCNKAFPHSSTLTKHKCTQRPCVQ